MKWKDKKKAHDTSAVDSPISKIIPSFDSCNELRENPGKHRATRPKRKSIVVSL